ncbi:MAG: hypothetical protein ACRD21_27515, partial [Vicinamibacteria bacterium]
MSRLEDRLSPQRASLAVGIVALSALAIGSLWRPEQFFRSYLFGYLPWLGLSLGSLAILMLHHLASGEWGHVIRRFLEAATENLLLLAPLFLPIALGVGSIYEWARPIEIAVPRLLEQPSSYLSVPFFRVRAALYFAVWILLAVRLNRLSERQEREGGSLRPLQSTSAPGLILYGITITFAAVDWAMSLETHWYSTIFGIALMTGQCLSALAFGALALHLFSKRSPLDEMLRPSHFHDLGNMILAFVMLWAYMAYSQYLIIWSGNLPEEIRWYLGRSGGWEKLACVLILLHFAVPFLLLLSRALKQSGKTLAWIAGLVLFMRFVDNFWIVAPAFHPGRF